MLRPLRGLRAEGAGLVLVPLSACNTVSSLLPAGLSDALTPIT